MRFRDISISWKLTLLAVVTTLFSMVAVICTVALIDRQMSRMSMVENYVTLADIVGHHCLSSLERSDIEGETQSLLALRKDRQVASACLYDVDGNARSTLPVHSKDAPSFDLVQQLNGTFSDDGYLHVVRPIRRDRTRLGHLYLRISDEKRSSQWWDQFVLAASIVCLSLLMAVAFAGRLQRWISGPVLHLVDTAHHIAKSGDFSIRAEKETGDELGELTDEFNAMLSAIEARDAELENHQLNLEELVSERTIELEQKTKEAQAASIAKSAFLANMSHEIRTPMNAVIGFANMLRNGNVENEEERVEFLNIICSSGEHLLGLISDILDLSKIEAGCMTTENLLISPHQLISDVVSITRVNALTKGLVLDYAWNGPIPSRIMTDPAKLRQLLINLIGNAIKFTERGGVHIIARLGFDHRSLQIQVIDSGIGIPSDKLGTIFTPFSQADASMTRRFGGTGLGLSISRKIAEALGGSLDVESEPGTGSTFTATIAIGDVGKLESDPTAPTSDLIPSGDDDSSEETGTIRRGCRVLLVEDGDTNRRLIHKMLERHGISVTDAVNGQIGVELATTQEFDLILMDMQMPVMDGYTAAKALRAMGLTIPIVALTAHAMSGDAEKCRHAGCSEYLTKPIQEARLLAKMTQLLNRQASNPSDGTHQFDDRREVDHGAEPCEFPRKPNTACHRRNAANEVESACQMTVTCALPLDDDVFREIVMEFSEKVQTQVERMKLAIAAEEWNELVDLAHWLKGSGGTAGYEQFTIPSGRLERLAVQRSHDKIELVIREIDEIAKAVAREMASLPILA